MNHSRWIGRRGFYMFVKMTFATIGYTKVGIHYLIRKNSHFFKFHIRKLN